MDKDRFLNLVRNPHQLTIHDVEALEEVVQVFPYCGLAHILLAKYHYDQADRLAPQKLRKAAAYAVNRETLKKIVTGEVVEEHAAPALPSVERPLPASEQDARTEAPVLPVAQLPDSVTPPEEELPIDAPTELVFEQLIVPLQQPEEIKVNSVSEEVEEPPLQLGHLTDDDEAVEAFSKRIKRNVQREIINVFIQSEPRISSLNNPLRDSYTNRDLSEKSIQPAGLVSENLANLYIKQGKVDTAIEMLEKLKLKYPEKKAYFAGRIEDLKQQ